jgi:hypothetical protein
MRVVPVVNREIQPDAGSMLGLAEEQTGNNFPDSQPQDAEKKSKSSNRQVAKSAKVRERGRESKRETNR